MRIILQESEGITLETFKRAKWKGDLLTAPYGVACAAVSVRDFPNGSRRLSVTLVTKLEYKYGRFTKDRNPLNSTFTVDSDYSQRVGNPWHLYKTCEGASTRDEYDPYPPASDAAREVWSIFKPMIQQKYWPASKSAIKEMWDQVDLNLSLINKNYKYLTDNKSRFNSYSDKIKIDIKKNGSKIEVRFYTTDRRLSDVFDEGYITGFILHGKGGYYEFLTGSCYESDRDNEAISNNDIINEEMAFNTAWHIYEGLTEVEGNNDFYEPEKFEEKLRLENFEDEHLGNCSKKKKLKEDVTEIELDHLLEYFWTKGKQHSELDHRQSDQAFMKCLRLEIPPNMRKDINGDIIKRLKQAWDDGIDYENSNYRNEVAATIDSDWED